MTFWTYMLHCRGGYFYVGHSDNLDRRIAEHETGAISGFTASHLPVRLVWSEMFATRDEARDAEKRLKGWSRAKKLALIRGDWERIAKLAKNKNGASTGSARTEFPITLRLKAHPASPARAIDGVACTVTRGEGGLWHLAYVVSGDIAALVVPEHRAPDRTDELWKTTCFEIFIRPGEVDDYWEFNLSPSTRWAAYGFDGYRSGMHDLPAERPPAIAVEQDAEQLRLNATIDLAGLSQDIDWRVSLSTVIEEVDGTKSYWALAHTPGEFDFHDDTCFVLDIPAAG